MEQGCWPSHYSSKLWKDEWWGWWWKHFNNRNNSNNNYDVVNDELEGKMKEENLFEQNKKEKIEDNS